MTDDNIKSVALWPRIREIKERRGKEADDVRLVSQLGWLFFFDRITEAQFEAGEWWARAGRWQLKAKFDRKPTANTGKLEPRTPGRDTKEHVPSGLFERIREALRKKQPSIPKTLDNLCIYDLFPCTRDELKQARHALDALANYLRTEENNGGAINCHYCGKPIRERRRGKQYCDPKHRVYGNREKRNNGQKSVTDKT
jgi:hypothetical protein